MSEKLTPAQAFHQKRRENFQYAMQETLIAFCNDSANDELDTAPGMTALREVARFMGDTMFRMYEGTPVPSEGFPTQEVLANHIFEFCSGEAGKVFASLAGNGPLEITAASIEEAPATLQ
jgi:hypothetical protein